MKNLNIPKYNELNYANQDYGDYLPLEKTIPTIKSKETATFFPSNIYSTDKVLPLPYFKRDLVVKDNFESSYPTNKISNPQYPGRWNWGQFPNGYGQGNAMGHKNCSPYNINKCNLNDVPNGYVSQKTIKLIEAYNTDFVPTSLLYIRNPYC
jgi:hypothetical protein